MEWPQTLSWRTGEYEDRWDEYEITGVPTRLLKCPVCKALLDDWDADAHRAWHEGVGK